MQRFFFRYAPVIIAVAGILFWVSHYFFDTFAGLYGKVIWLPYMLAQITFYLLCGRLIQRLHQGMQNDALTGLGNRRCFYEKLADEIERMRRAGTPLTLMMIDVDNFKRINDRYGHHAGDKVLRHLAVILQQNIRSIDTVCRWGGEEFAIILPATNTEGALVLAERLRQSVESAQSLYNTTISLGVLSSNQVTDPDDFVRRTDNALYKAKGKKNTVVAA